MVEGAKARALVTKHLPGWHCCAVDSVGQFGGLCVAWNPMKMVLKPFTTCAGILLEGQVVEGNKSITLFNFYGPYTDRKSFWDVVVASGMLASKNLVLAGDLNFTVAANEVWGTKARLDPLAKYFQEIFKNYGLVDIVPLQHVPTWRNGREGTESIEK
jgi:hypothetical protein